MPAYAIQLAMPEPPVSTDCGGFAVTFPFAVIPQEAVGTPLQSASSTTGIIIAKITGSLLAVWKIPTDAVLKIMLYLLRDHIARQLDATGLLPTNAVVELTTYNFPGACPFDLALLEDLPGSSALVAINRPIGFVHASRDHT